MSKNPAPETFQISTEQLFLTRQMPTESQYIQVASEQVRVDQSTHHTGTPHFRAAQLKDFTNWLAQSNQQPITQPNPPQNIKTNSPTTTSSNEVVFPKSKTDSPRTYRFDGPATAQNQPLKKPNFETRNYVADPADIQKTIAQLKSDGRVIGDWRQLEDQESIANPTFQTFRWPQVVQQMVERNSMTHLEMNLQNLLGRSCKHVVVCSSEYNAGATTIAMSLARQFSRNKNVLLVDANTNNAVLAARLGVKFQSSWLQAISERSALPDVIVSDTDTNVSLLPLKNLSKVKWPRRILDELNSTIITIENQYDTIVYDAGLSSQFMNESSPHKVMGDVILFVDNQASQESLETKFEKSKILASNKNVILVENFASVSQSQQTKVG